MKHKAPEPSGSASGVAMIVLTLIGWSSIPLFLFSFTKQIDGWTANGWRYAVSALLWLPVLLLGAARRKTTPGLWRAALVPSLFNVPAQVCFAFAPYFVPPGLMTFSMRVNIVFLTVGAAIMFASERRIIRTPIFLWGVALVIGGTTGTLLLGPEGLGILRGGSALGVAFSVGAGGLYAAYSLSVRRYMHGMPPLEAFAAVSLYTGIAQVALMVAFGDRHGMAALDLSGFQFMMLMLSAIIGIGMGHTLYYFAIARLGLAVASGVVQLQPVTVAIASYFIFHERLNVPQWVSGLVAVGGAGAMLYAQHRMTSRKTVAPDTALAEAAGEVGA